MDYNKDVEIRHPKELRGGIAELQSALSIAIIAISYGTTAALIIWLSLLFFSWYRSTHNLIVLLYFLSMSVIAFNLIMAASFASIKVSERPYHIGEFIGGSGDISGGRHLLLDNTFRVSSFMSFFSIWITTAILMNYYREKLVNAMIFWLILSLPTRLFPDNLLLPVFLGQDINLLSSN